MKKFELGYALKVGGRKVVRTIYVYAENKLTAKIEARRRLPKFTDEFEWVTECEQGRVSK